MTFVEATCGTSVRVDDVREVHNSTDDEHIAILRFEDGRERQVTWDDWSYAEWLENHVVIPAQAGTFVVHTDCDGKLVCREPVIGWAVGGRGFVRPITSTGFRPFLDEDPLIQHPDGTVQDVLGLYASYNQWSEQLTVDYDKSPVAVAARRAGRN